MRSTSERRFYFPVSAVFALAVQPERLTSWSAARDRTTHPLSGCLQLRRLIPALVQAGSAVPRRSVQGREPARGLVKSGTLRIAKGGGGPTPPARVWEKDAEFVGNSILWRRQTRLFQFRALFHVSGIRNASQIAREAGRWDCEPSKNADTCAGGSEFGFRVLLQLKSALTDV
jgi:hypothetical protein